MGKDILEDMTLDDIKNIDNKVRRALAFAVYAHKGQVRKSEPDRPKVLHPIEVANILKKYGYGVDKNLIAAGYLHDVVEDTNFTLDDIFEYFGEDIKELVEAATEKDKSLSWEVRKLETIEKAKNLPVRKKLVIIADKINNVEDLAKVFERQGFKDFSKFNRGEVQQEWYYRNVWKALRLGMENDPMIRRLEMGVNEAFDRTMESYFKENEKIKELK